MKTNQKEVSLKFRVTPKEKALIVAKAKEADKTFSEYARFMLINGEVINISDEERRTLVGLGNNINQLTRLYHRTKMVPSNLLLELQKTLKLLKNGYRRGA